jgi:hypothetical protein
MTPAMPRENSLRFVDTGPRDDDDGRMRCPVTGAVCTGILAHLCEDYGCARKAGLSPHPDENV